MHRKRNPCSGMIRAVLANNESRKALFACFEFARLKFDGCHSDVDALASIRKKYGDEVAGIVEKVAEDWRRDPEHFGERIPTGNLPHDAFLGKLKCRT